MDPLSDLRDYASFTYFILYILLILSKRTSAFLASPRLIIRVIRLPREIRHGRLFHRGELPQATRVKKRYVCGGLRPSAVN